MRSPVTDGRWRGRSAWLTFGLALLVGLVAAGITWGVVASQKAQYESVATLAIDQPRAIAASGDAGVISKLSSLRLKYAGLVTTQAFAAPLAQGLSGADPIRVRNALFARVPGNSLLLQVGAQGHDRQAARSIADAAANSLVSYVQDEQQKAGIPTAQQFTFTVVTPAAAARKISPTNRKIAGATALAGLLGFAVVVAALSLRSRDEA